MTSIFFLFILVISFKAPKLFMTDTCAHTHKYNLYTLCIHIIIGYAEYGIPIQHQTTIHFLKQRSNSAQQKIDLFYGVYLSKHFPACESLEIASTFFSLATLKFSLLLTQTQGKDFGSYGYRALTCNIRMMMKADCKHSGFIKTGYKKNLNKRIYVL